jgi:hypothetical protein
MSAVFGGQVRGIGATLHVQAKTSAAFFVTPAKRKLPWQPAKRTSKPAPLRRMFLNLDARHRRRRSRSTNEEGSETSMMMVQ